MTSWATCSVLNEHDFHLSFYMRFTLFLLTQVPVLKVLQTHLFYGTKSLKESWPLVGTVCIFPEPIELWSTLAKNNAGSLIDFLLQTHLQSCGCKITSCPNLHCDVTMERRLVDDHVKNTCPWRTVQCGYCDKKHAKYDEEVTNSLPIAIKQRCHWSLDNDNDNK